MTAKKPDALAAKLADMGATVTRNTDGSLHSIKIPVGSVSGTGHNSGTRAESGNDRLRLLLERIERLEEEKRGIADDIKDVYGEARMTGYDPKILRKIIALRKMKPDDRREMEAILETYKNALGMD